MLALPAALGREAFPEAEDAPATLSRWPHFCRPRANTVRSKLSSRGHVGPKPGIRSSGRAEGDVEAQDQPTEARPALREAPVPTHFSQSTEQVTQCLRDHCRRYTLQQAFSGNRHTFSECVGLVAWAEQEEQILEKSWF